MHWRWIVGLALFLGLAGCKNGPLTTENLFGNRTTIPAPGTGTAGATPPYDPFAPAVPQTAPGGPPPAAGGGFTPPPPAANPGGFAPSGAPAAPGYVPPGNYAPPGGSFQTSGAPTNPRDRYAYRYGGAPAATTPPQNWATAPPTLAPVPQGSPESAATAGEPEPFDGRSPTAPGAWRDGGSARASASANEWDDQNSGAAPPPGAGARRGASPDDEVGFSGASSVRLAGAGEADLVDRVETAGAEVPQTTGQRRFAHHPQFQWVEGRLDFVEESRRWRIRYRPVGDEDEWGGVLWLAETTALDGFQAGDFVAIQGAFSGQPAPEGPMPEYQIERIRPQES